MNYDVECREREYPYLHSTLYGEYKYDAPFAFRFGGVNIIGGDIKGYIEGKIEGDIGSNSG